MTRQLMADILLAFKAGRAFRQEGSNLVEPNATKGAIIVKNGDDGLLHFMWKNRVTNDVEEVRSFQVHCNEFIHCNSRT